MVVGLVVGLLAWTAVCVAMAWRYPRRVRAATGARWRADLEESYRVARGDPARIAAVNDALADVEHDLDAAARFPVTAGWLAVNGWLLTVLAGLLWGREPLLLASLPIGFGGLVGTQSARRRGLRKARACREEADRIISELAGELVHREVEMPVRRRRRGRRRRA